MTADYSPERVAERVAAITEQPALLVAFVQAVVGGVVPTGEAHRQLALWSRMPTWERANVLWDLRDAIDREMLHLAQTETAVARADDDAADPDLPKLPWYRRDELRMQVGLLPDGLWNLDLPCGACLCGITIDQRAIRERLHISMCSRCREQQAARVNATAKGVR